MPPTFLSLKRATANTPHLLMPVGERVEKVKKYLKPEYKWQGGVKYAYAAYDEYIP